jgi:hypothetical protein
MNAAAITVITAICLLRKNLTLGRYCPLPACFAQSTPHSPPAEFSRKTIATCNDELEYRHDEKL